jgi:hypothetical protein
VPTNVAQALVEGLEHDFVADDRELRHLVPRQLMGLEESVQAAIDADRRHDTTVRWVEGAIACRNFRPVYGFYAKRAGATAEGPADTEATFAVVCRTGGDEGYFFANGLWWMRRAFDWLAGGPSFRRARRHPTDLRVGDVVDSWRVIALEPGRRLTLLMEMKAPGAGVLEFVVNPGPGGSGSSVTATAYWHPAGASGLVYWHALVPAHLFLFRGLTRAIHRRASAQGHSGSSTLRGPK